MIHRLTAGQRNKEKAITSPRKTEIIAICSGKGGTGKTLIASCLGYALMNAGQKVLMIDGDPATSGLSLFLLGPKGMDQVPYFGNENTFVGLLNEFQQTGTMSVMPRAIHRSSSNDHGVSYESIICSNGLYGERDQIHPGREAQQTRSVFTAPDRANIPDLDQSSFRAGIRRLFDILRDSQTYDYVLVDTRGGFAFESTDVCALADSFILVTEATTSSFYQDRNLVDRISFAAVEVSSPSVVRAVIVNKAVNSVKQENATYLETLEQSFRIDLTKDLSIPYSSTYAIPADLDALQAYKLQEIPYITVPASMFSYASLASFSDIVKIVTSQWSSEDVKKWNGLVDKVLEAVRHANEAAREERRVEEEREKELAMLRTERDLVAYKLSSLEEKDNARSIERDLGYRKEVLHIAQRTSQRARVQTYIAFGLAFVIAITATVLFVKERRDRAAELNLLSKRNEDALLSTLDSVRKQQMQLEELTAEADRTSRFASKSQDESPTITRTPVFPLPGNVAGGNFGIVVSNDRDLEPSGPGAPSAAFEAQLALQIGNKGVTVYKKQLYYATVIPFATESDAQLGLTQLHLWNKGRWKSAYTARLQSWCPNLIPQFSTSSNGVHIPVVLCASEPKD